LIDTSVHFEDEYYTVANFVLSWRVTREVQFSQCM